MNTDNDTTTQTVEAVMNEAEQVQQERMEAVRKLADSVAHRGHLEEQLREAEKDVKQCSRDARKAGWTDGQVTRFIKTAKSPRRAKGATGNSHSSGATDTGSSTDEQTADTVENEPNLGTH